MNRLGLYLLTVGAFLAVTAELMLVGVVDMIARDLHVPISLVGQLVTAYALAFAIGTPIVITLTSRFERKRVMLTAFFFFINANLVTLWSPNFTVLMFSRVFLGISGGVFTVVAMGAVSKLVPPEKLGGAISTLMMGLSGSLVFGVPLGVVLSEWIGWQLAFGVLAALSILIMIGITLVVPSIPGGEIIPFKQQLSVLKNWKIVSGFFITLFVNAGYSTSYTFLVPFLQETVHMDTSMISITLFVVGVFSMIGTRLGGYGADHWGVARTAFSSMMIHALTLLFLPVLTTSIVTATIMVVIWMGSNWMSSPTLQTYFVQQTPKTPDLALSLNTSVIQLGIALGAGIGGFIVNSTGNVTNTPYAGAFMVLLGIVAAWISFALQTKPSVGQV